MTSPTAPTAPVSAGTPVEGDEPTIGRLVADVSRDLSSLVHNEIALAKSELKLSVKAGGTGVGLFAGAAFIAVLAIIMLSVSLAHFISWTGLPLAVSYLIVFGLYLLIAGLLAWIGLRKVKQVRGPERAIHQAQETKTALQRK